MKNQFLLASLLLLFFSACSSENGPNTGTSAGRSPQGGGPGVQQSEVAMSVEGHKVSIRSISEYVITNTSLESIREVIVYSKVSAMVTERHFEEGDVIGEGDLLVRLHDDEIINNLEQAKIALTQSEVAVEQAEVNAELSAAEFERVKSLYNQQLISQQEYDQSEIASRSDSLSLDNSKRQLEAARSRLEASEIQVAYTTVKSPISGVVTSRLVNVGDRVSSNQQLLTLQEFPPLWARIYIPEKTMPKIKLGQLARLAMETYPDREFNGRIKLMSPTIKADSGTLKVTIEIDKDTQLLRPGMFGTVYIATDTHDNAVVIPKKSIIRERNANYVYVINSDNTVTRQEVTVGFGDEDQVEIAQGLQGNEAIVTVGQETLSDGYPIIVRSWSDGSDGGDVLLAQSAKPAAAVDTAPTPAGAGSMASAQAVEGRAGSRQPGGDASDRFMRMVETNPALKKAWDEKVKEDPEVATDPEKRSAAIQEIMTEMRGSSSGGMLPPRGMMGGGRP
ncbi:MAG: efflux RND transporter periplasmic adaptor subunit [Acidobacteriota bacterium]